MSDRFKFRVWDIEDCSYFEPRDFDDIWLNENTELRVGFYSDATQMIEDYTDNVIIEQCTGLKDKNGNLIYENDRITIRHETGKVCFGFYRKTEEHFPDGIYGWYIEWEKPNCWLRQDLGYFITEGIEIIGNIHEQKEEQ